MEAVAQEHRIRRVAAALAPRVAWRRVLKWAALAVFALVVLGFGIHYWRISQAYESTNDAYINADTTQIAAQVAGLVLHVYVRDQQHVKDRKSVV